MESVGCLESCPPSQLPSPRQPGSPWPAWPLGLPGHPLLLQASSLRSPFSKLYFLSSTSSPGPLKAKPPLLYWLLREEFPGSESNHSSRANGHAVHRRPHSGPGPPLGWGKGRPWRKGLHPAWPAASASLLSCSRPTCGPLVGQLRCSLTVGSPERLGARASQARSCSSCRGFIPQNATRRVLRKHNPGGNVCHFLC